MNQSTFDEDKIMEKVLDTFQNQGVAMMSHAEKAAYLAALMVTACTLMRSVEGDKWVRGFLETALDALDKPPEVTFRQFS